MINGLKEGQVLGSSGLNLIVLIDVL
jgi:hypothetical protein